MTQSYSTIVSALRQFSEAHQNVNRFKASFLEQLENFSTEEKSFPILFAQPESIGIEENIDSFNFRVYCLDILQKDRANEEPVMNSTLLVLTDLVNWLRRDTTIDLNLLNNPTAIPVNNYLQDFTAGWYIDLEIEGNGEKSSCSIPFSAGFQLTGVTMDVQTIQRFLTCDTLVYCSNYLNIINDSVSTTSLSADTIYSGSTNLYDIFSTVGGADTILPPTQIAFGNSLSAITGTSSLTYTEPSAGIARLTVGSSSNNGQLDFTSPASGVFRIEGGSSTYITQFNAGDIYIRNNTGLHSLVLQENATVRAISLSATTLSATSIFTPYIQLGTPASNITYYTGNILYGGSANQSFLQLDSGLAQIGHYANRTLYQNDVGIVNYVYGIETQRQTNLLTTINTDVLITGSTRTSSLSATSISASTLVLPSIPTGRILYTNSSSAVTGQNLYMNETGGNYYIDIATYMQVGFLNGYQQIHTAGGYPFRIEQFATTLLMDSDGYTFKNAGWFDVNAGRFTIEALASASDGVVYATSAGTLSKQVLPTNQIAFGSSLSGISGDTLFKIFPNAVGGGYAQLGYANIGYGIAYGGYFGIDLSAFGTTRISNALSFIEFDRISGVGGNLKFNVNGEIFRATYSGLSVFHTNESTAHIDIASASTSQASLRIRSGATVSSPNDGDIWNDGTHLYGKFGGEVKQLDASGGTSSSGGTVSLNPTQIAFGNSSSGLTGSTDLVYNDVAKLMTVGTLYAGIMGSGIAGIQSTTTQLGLYAQASACYMFLNSDGNIRATSTEFSNTGGFRGSYLSATTLSAGTLSIDSNSTLTLLNANSNTFSLSRGGVVGLSLNDSNYTDLSQSNGVRIAGSVKIGGGANPVYPLDVIGRINSDSLSATTLSASTAKLGDTMHRYNVGGGYTDTIEMPSFGRLYSNGNLYLYGGANLFLDGSSSITLASSDKVIISPNSELLVNGSTRSTSLSATSISASTLYSGATDLSLIFVTHDQNTVTNVQNGLNTYTGGTATAPTINISGGSFSSISATTVSGGTIYSGSTNLGSIFQTKINQPDYQLLYSVSNTVTSDTGLTYDGSSLVLNDKGFRGAIKKVSSDYSASTLDFTIVCQIGTTQVFVPVSDATTKGLVLNIKNASTGSDILVSVAGGSQNIDGGGANYPVASSYSLCIQSDGLGDWWII